MMVYTVQVHVDPSIVDDFLEWIRPHIGHILETGCFVSASVERLLDPATDVPVISMRYTFKTLKDFKRYETDHAPALRKAGITRFGEKVTITRSINDVLAFESASGSPPSEGIASNDDSSSTQADTAG